MNMNNTLLPIRAVFAAVGCLCSAASAMEPVPDISSVSYSSNSLTLSISNISTGGTYYVESQGSLVGTNWTEAGSFEGIVGSTNWTESAPGAATSAFYRVVRETYHPKVGKVASLDVPGFHDVSGTAHIINNHSIELRNFNFDGGGIVIQVYISPNSSFSPYSAISGDLFGQVFNDDTLLLDIPEGTDLDNVNYISIWCVAAGVSFGDGPFQ